MCDLARETGSLPLCVPHLTFPGMLLLTRCRYLLNPYIFLPTLALSTSSYENATLLLAVMFASQSVFSFTQCRWVFHWR